MKDIHEPTKEEFLKVLQWMRDNGVPIWIIDFVSNLFYYVIKDD